MSGIAEYIEAVMAGTDLDVEQSQGVLDEIFGGEVPEVQTAAFLTALRVKGETAAELAGFAGSLRAHAVKVEVDGDGLVDTCGTGGARVKTFNISTAAAFTAAGAGVRIAKHGNRGITSKCGSADVLLELGVNIECGSGRVAECIEQAGIGFMFAPLFHPAMRYVQPVRKNLGFRTVFNILGPLANPAGAGAQVMGVADESLMAMVAEALALLGVRRALVVHSDGLDEISTMGVTKIIDVCEGQFREMVFRGADHGIAEASLEELAGGDAKANAGMVRDVLSGAERGCRRDIVVVNASAAILASGAAMDFSEGIEIAAESIDSGAAAEKLAKLIEISNR